jgi:GNAT superfamily N-acetyltransferase
LPPAGPQSPPPVSEGIQIRAAQPSEFPACRMLLPPEPIGNSGLHYLLAVQAQAPFIVGAAAYVPASRVTHGIRMRVIRGHRGKGVGSRLLAHLEALARQRGAEGLVAVANSVTEPDARAFLESQGFRMQGRTTTVRATMESATSIILPLAERISKRMPGHEKIVPLSQAPQNAVTALYKAELARHPLVTPWALLDSIGSVRFAKSPVLMSGSAVAGFLLVCMEGDLGMIFARIVAPEFQRGGANVLLMAEGLRRGLEDGARGIEFEIPPDNYDTENLARRLNAEVVRTKDQYVKRLPPA